MFRTVEQGQVNLLLALAVTIDVLVVPRQSPWRGVLVGLAAGIKVVPGAFVLVFLAQRDWRATGRAALSWATSVALTLLVAPRAAEEYWLHLLFDTSRSGGGGYPDNQSLAGVLARVLEEDHPAPLLLLPLQASALLLGYLGCRRAISAGRPEAGLLCIALAALLASPVSWSHHWVWCVPLLMLFWHERRWWWLATSSAVFLVPPLLLSPLGLIPLEPRAFWVLTTALFPALAIAFLLSETTGKGAKRATQRAPGTTSPNATDNRGVKRATQRAPGTATHSRRRSRRAD